MPAETDNRFFARGEVRRLHATKNNACNQIRIHNFSQAAAAAAIIDGPHIYTIQNRTRERSTACVSVRGYVCECVSVRMFVCVCARKEEVAKKMKPLLLLHYMARPTGSQWLRLLTPVGASSSSSSSWARVIYRKTNGNKR